jgi:hypothetical protein
MGFSTLGFNSPQGGLVGFSPSQGSDSGEAVSTLLTDIRHWWKMDDDGAWIDSATSTSYFSEINSPTTVAGKINFAIDTYGSSAPHLSTNDTGVDFLSSGNSDWTCSAWVKPITSGYGGADGKTFVLTPAQFNFGMKPEAVGNFLWFNAKIGGSYVSTDMTGTAASEIPDDTWGMCFWQFSAASGGSSVMTLRTIVGGTEYTVTGSHGGTVSARTSPGYTMKIGYINNDYKAGSALDMVGIWSRHLTAAERLELYNSGSAKDYPFV